MKRRRFFATSLASLTAAQWVRAQGANQRLGLAVVGCGIRGRAVTRHLLATDRVEIRALCDVFPERWQVACDSWKLKNKPIQSVAIEEVLSSPHIDAVLVAVPDHLHTEIATKVIAANKHLYLEKPVTHHFSENRLLRGAAEGKTCVVQTGTQQRSSPHYRQAKEMFIDSGRLGDVVLVRGVWHNFPNQRRPLQAKAKPEGLDWERFLGPAPPRPFEWPRYDSWRLFRDYGGGQLSDILTHWVDVAQWFMEERRPLDAVATGGIYYLNDGRENPDTVTAVLRYPRWNFVFECSILPIAGTRPGVTFFGTRGTLEVTRNGYTFQPERGSRVDVEAKTDVDQDHADNWIAAIDNSTTPSAGLEMGLGACEAIHLARAAYWSGKRARFDDSVTTILEG